MFVPIFLSFGFESNRARIQLEITNRAAKLYPNILEES